MHTVMHRESSGLVRTRLLADLNTVRTAPLALVTAPAGFGKTTLLTHYAHYFRNTIGGSVGWLGVGPGHADPARLVADIRRCIPCELPEPRDENDIDELLREVDAAAADHMLLVLDDVHCLDNSPSEQILDRLLAVAPGRLHLVIASRRLPRLNLARHELADVTIIDAEQLRFRSWETEQLLRLVYREPLPPADIAALDRRIGGWVAGLQLFHLSTRGRTLAERREAVAALDGRATLVRAYLARTVLAELPAKLRDFLVRTSVFDVLTAARCDKLLRRHDSARHLAELERLQAFTTSPDGGRTYRYHEALRSHLAATLSDGIGDKAARRHHSRAAQLLLEEGALTEAARAYARAEDWTTVRRLLARIGAGIVDDGVEPWRDVLPAWLVAEDPWLRLAEGKHLFSRGQLSAAADCLIRGAALFGDDDGRAHSRAALARVSVWMPGPAGPQGIWVNRLRAATQRHPAIAAAQAERLPSPYGPLVRALAHVLTGRLSEALGVLSTVEAEGSDMVMLALRCCHAIRLLVEDPGAGASRLSELSAEAERAQYPWLARMARAAVALDGTEASAKVAIGVAEECAREGDDWGAVLATGLGWLQHAGTSYADPVALAELTERCARLDAGVLHSWAQSLYALSAVAAHLPDAEVEAARAVAMARAAGAQGAQVAGLVASARVASVAEQAEELTDRARLLATECGLPQSLVDVWLDAPPDTRPTPAARAPLALLCLGGFQAFRDGVQLDFTVVKPRARALLRLLALRSGTGVHRETLVDALWPSLPPAAATHSLHVAVSSLRRLLEPGVERGAHRVLVREGDSYRLVLPPDGYCDVATFRTAADAARRVRLGGDVEATVTALRGLLTAYTGDLLPEDGASEWVVREREQLRRTAADAAASLAALELARSDAGAATAVAERCVGIDRYHDEGWRLLIEACERNGNPAAAREARGRYGQVLAELEVEGV